MTAGDPVEVAVLIGHDRDAATACRDDDEAGVDERPDCRHLDDAYRRRRGDDSAPAAVGILDEVPALLPPALGHLLVHERADRLARVGEGRVVGAHFCLADDSGGMPVDSIAAKLVVEVLLQGVPDGALGVGPADVERHLVEL